jgi:uncharacterized surface protein with fasciclin (FAS1) repeats
MKLNINILVCALFALLLWNCKGEVANEDKNNTTSENTEETRTGQAFVTDDESKPSVLHIAIGSKDHSTLVAAVQAAKLENALVNAGPLMVFAPTNDAFAALPEGTEYKAMMYLLVALKSLQVYRPVMVLYMW